MKAKQPDRTLTEKEVAQRRDDAIRRALNTPPKPYKDAKVGKQKAKAVHPKKG